MLPGTSSSCSTLAVTVVGDSRHGVCYMGGGGGVALDALVKLYHAQHAAGSLSIVQVRRASGGARSIR